MEKKKGKHQKSTPSSPVKKQIASALDKLVAPSGKTREEVRLKLKVNMKDIQPLAPVVDTATGASEPENPSNPEGSQDRASEQEPSPHGEDDSVSMMSTLTDTLLPLVSTPSIPSAVLEEELAEEGSGLSPEEVRGPISSSAALAEELEIGAPAETPRHGQNHPLLRKDMKQPAYSVTPQMMAHLASPKSELTSALEDELQMWWTDKWDSLVDPPASLTRDHYIYCFPYGTNNSARCLSFKRATRNLAAARLSGRRRPDARDHSYKEAVTQMLKDPGEGFLEVLDSVEALNKVIGAQASIHAALLETYKEFSDQAVQTMRNFKTDSEVVATSLSTKVEQLIQITQQLTELSDTQIGKVLKGKGYPESVIYSNKATIRAKDPKEKTKKMPRIGALSKYD